MTPELLASLPGWALFALAVIWVVVSQVVPRINKAAPPLKSTNPSAPTMAAISPISGMQRPPRDEEMHDRMRELGDIVEANASSAARFEQALERHFELDRQQFELLRAIAGQLQADSRAIAQISEALTETKVAMKVIAQTQETIMRRVLEDTGRFNLPSQRG